MDALKFIVKDIERAQQGSPFLKALFLLGLFIFPMLLGLGLRASTDGAFATDTFIPNLFASLLLVMIPGFFMFRRKLSPINLVLYATTALFCLILSIKRVLTAAPSEIASPSSAVFLHDASMCFSKGSVSILFIGAWITYFSFTLTAWPSRMWRFFLSMVAGLSGAVMLAFHCDSTSPAHIMLGHLLPGMIFGGFIFLIQERLLKRWSPPFSG